MCDQLKSVVSIWVTVLTLCAFAMPMLCSSAHAHGHSASSFEQVHSNDKIIEKTGSGKAQESHASFPCDHCGFGHHCCASSMVLPSNPPFIVFPLKIMSHGLPERHVLVDNNIPSLERPPKTLVPAA